MKTIKFDGVIENAWGKAVSPAVKFAGSYEAFQTYAEIPEKELPSEKDVVAWANNRRKASERQKEMNAALALAGYEKPTLESDPQLQLKTIAKALMAAGKSEAEARNIASTTLGVEWDDE